MTVRSPLCSCQERRRGAAFISERRSSTSDPSSISAPLRGHSVLIHVAESVAAVAELEEVAILGELEAGAAESVTEEDEGSSAVGGE